MNSSNSLKISFSASIVACITNSLLVNSTKSPSRFLGSWLRFWVNFLVVILSFSSLNIPFAFSSSSIWESMSWYSSRMSFSEVTLTSSASLLLIFCKARSFGVLPIFSSSWSSFSDWRTSIPASCNFSLASVWESISWYSSRISFSEATLTSSANWELTLNKSRSSPLFSLVFSSLNPFWCSWKSPTVGTSNSSNLWWTTTSISSFSISSSLLTLVFDWSESSLPDIQVVESWSCLWIPSKQGWSVTAHSNSSKISRSDSLII